MPEIAGDNFTVKEMLVRIVLPKLESIEAKLDHSVERAEFISLGDRVGALELHGSSQAVDALRDIHELEKLVQDIRREQNSRAYYTKIVDTSVDRIDSLDTWRNRVVGGILVVGSVAFLNVLRVWFGI